MLYLTVRTGFAGASARYWVYAVRAAPLPPVWLHASPILFEAGANGEIEAEHGTEITLDASGLAPGVYEGVASVREGDGIGPVVAEVPVTLTVAPVDAEDEPEGQGSVRLGAPYPNPAERAAATSVTVPVVLAEPAEVRVAVFDVLGRRVVVLADGQMEAGEYRLAFDAAVLPAGVYLVRATAGDEVRTARLTLVR